LRNVLLENVNSTASPRVMWIVGFPGVTIEDVRFANCTFRGLNATEVVNHAGAISFKNVTIEPAKRGRSINSPQVDPKVPSE
jgi:unsaturated rhamnogalacturonyl hydrolase